MSERTEPIRTSQILAMLRAGKTRDEIREELGITKSEASVIFKLPSLKGVKTHKSRRLSVEVIDDVSNPDATSETIEASTEETAQDTPVTSTRRRSTAAIPVEAAEAASNVGEAPKEKPPVINPDVTNNAEVTPESTPETEEGNSWGFPDDVTTEEAEELDSEDDRPPFDSRG